MATKKSKMVVTGYTYWEDTPIGHQSGKCHHCGTMYVDGKLYRFCPWCGHKAVKKEEMPE